jgi:uridine kinase
MSRTVAIWGKVHFMNSNEFIEDLIKSRNFGLEASELGVKNTVSKLVSYLKRLRKKETKIISLVGGAASGKTTLATKIADELKSAAVISTDDFVLGDRRFRRKHMEGEGKSPLLKYDFELLRDKVERIKNLNDGETVCLPRYDGFRGRGLDISYDATTGQIISVGRDACERKIGKIDFLIVEGDFQILESPDYQIFLHVPDEVRLGNRISRDLRERGPSTSDEIVANFNLRQKLQHVPYTLTYANSADMLLLLDLSETNSGGDYKYSFWIRPQASS